MSLRRYRPVALVLMVLHLSACLSWQPTTVSPPQLIEGEEPSQVRITRTDGERVTIHSPQVRADSIVGDGGTVAVSSIQRVEVRRFSGVRTVILGLGVVLAPVVFYGLVVLAYAYRPHGPR